MLAIHQMGLSTWLYYGVAGREVLHTMTTRIGIVIELGELDGLIKEFLDLEANRGNTAMQLSLSLFLTYLQRKVKSHGEERVQRSADNAAL